MAATPRCSRCGARASKRARKCPHPANAEEIEMQRALKAFLKRKPGYLTETVKTIKGVSEETTTGVHRLYQHRQARQAAVPGDQRER